MTSPQHRLRIWNSEYGVLPVWNHYKYETGSNNVGRSYVIILLDNMKKIIRRLDAVVIESEEHFR